MTYWRHDLEALAEWRTTPRRKPLVLRGARQVGKTTLVQYFAEKSSIGLVGLNFERDPNLAQLFVGNDPRQTKARLELSLGRAITPGQTLLFLDEIQAAPQVFAALRYFYEELPELHVLAAGSLLDLALDRPEFSVPVGRLEYLHLGPMTFEEFLAAGAKGQLVEFLTRFQLGDDLPEPIHKQLLGEVARYLRVGGMPEAVDEFCARGSSYLAAERAKLSILATFQEDFGKYGRRVPIERVRKVFTQAPVQVGKKLKYVHLDRDERAKDLADALELLTQARVIAKVCHSSGNGVPLGAEADPRAFKLLFLDVGLMATATGLSSRDLETEPDLLLVQQGALAEQFVGQHLLYSGASWETPQLHYWLREKSGAEAEVDYLISTGDRVVPVEVKAGKTGRLRSLQQFVAEKGPRLCVRISSGKPALEVVVSQLPDGRNIDFQLLTLPLYLVGQIRRLIAEVSR